MAETVTASQNTVSSTEVQQPGPGSLKGGVKITAENLKGELPNDKYSNTLCTNRSVCVVQSEGRKC